MSVVKDKKYPSRICWVKDHYINFKEHMANVSPADALELIKNNDFELQDEYTCSFNRKTWCPNYKKLYWESNADTFSGFGSVSINAVKSLARNGIDVFFGGEQFDAKSYPDKEFDEYKKSTDPDCIVIQYRQPGQFRRKMAQRIFGYTPWETTKIPASWVPKMNELEVMFTTCEQNKQAFIDSGVKVPIYIYSHGIDPIQYPYIDRPKDSCFVFGTFGRLSVRKGTDLVIRAFKEEFKTEQDVALILKSSDAIIPFGSLNDQRIIPIGQVYNHQEKSDLLAKMDCLVFPSRGEGFGLPPLEAMATGLACIMTNWSGLKEFGDKKDTMLLDYKMVPAENFTKDIYKEECGDWAEPDFEQLKKYMRWAYEHREQVKEMGKKASQRVHKDWNWDIQTKKFIRILNKLI